MSKTIKIFIITFVVALSALIVFYWLTRNEKVDTQTGETPWYQEFNPFGTGGVINNIVDNGFWAGTDNQGENSQETETSRFYQITDFAVAGATFLLDTRPIENGSTTLNTTPKEVKIVLDGNTIDGRKDIQTFLNSTLSLKTPLKVDGNFGKMTTEAIKSFQKLNGIPETGKIDEVTSPLFVKTTIINNIPEKAQYENVPSIRYVERTNGHIYRMFWDKKTPEKISNSTIPSIHEAIFDGTGKTVIYRYLSEDKTISTFLATLGATKGEFLSQNISDVSTSEDKTRYFYLIKNNDGITGMVRVFGGSGGAVAFNSPFTEWLSQWAGNKKIFLTTKPSFSVEGSMFSLDTTNKTTLKVLGGIAGLTTLIDDTGSTILYGTSTSSGPKLGIFDISKNSTTADLNIYGLPEKCVWSSDNINVYCAVPNTIVGNQYPDVWYQGLVSFDDYFVKINTRTGKVATMANSANETPVDGTHLFLDNDEKTLFFINKKDSTLWSLNIE